MRFDAHDEQLEFLAQTAAKHTDVLDHHTQILDHHTQILDQHTQILDQHTQILHQHTRILEKHTDQLDHMESVLQNTATKSDVNNLTNSVDEIVKLYRKKDQEMTFMSQHLKRLDEVVGLT